MKASELVGDTHFKALIYGDSGTGKTVFASSFASLGPVEYWDFDNKLSSAVSYFKRTDQLGLLDQIEVYQFGSLRLLDRIPAFEQRTKFIDECVRTKKELPFKTLVVDSITTLSHFIMEDYIFRSQRGVKRPLEGINALQDYSLYEKHMTRVLTGILALPINVIVLGHVHTDKDETTGQIMRLPMASGRALGPKLPIWFEEVYVSQVKPDGKRVFLTHPQNGYIARTQRGLEREVPMTLDAVMK